MLKKLVFMLFVSLNSIGFSKEKSNKNYSEILKSFTDSTSTIFKINTKSTFIFHSKKNRESIVFTKNITNNNSKNSMPFHKNNSVNLFSSFGAQNRTVSKSPVI
jgi:Holliday junction resolvasome RuvABC DNA-binding subunit